MSVEISGGAKHRSESESDSPADEITDTRAAYDRSRESAARFISPSEDIHAPSRTFRAASAHGAANAPDVKKVMSEHPLTAAHREHTAHDAVPSDPWDELTPESSEPEWEESRVHVGDGPFAAPLDAPAPRASGSRSIPKRVARPELSTPQLGGPLVMQRRFDHRAEPSRRSLPPERQYPRLRALLANPEASRAPAARTLPLPVPGTFFPAARPPSKAPGPKDLDQLLATMAEGLLIGETPTGETEVRVTLRDEFFAGTELRIAAGAGQISARLSPPDRATYWALNANLDELRERLAGRGLRVHELEVLEP